MEVRAGKKKKRTLPKSNIDKRVLIRTLLAAAVLFTLALVFVWRFGSKTTLAVEDRAEEPRERVINILEIEPCNSFWLTGSDGSKPMGEQNALRQLAIALGENEEALSVTHVTPNSLNGMTADLAAEYDVIVIGDKTELFREDSAARASVYTHIGEAGDAIIPQTLINGLLNSDYTTEQEFNDILKAIIDKKLNLNGTVLENSANELWNPGIKSQWGSTSGQYFLKNVELSLELASLTATAGPAADPTSSVSKARFSGNDVTKYMQKQLAEFAKSGQPIILGDSIKSLASEQIAEFNKSDVQKTDPEPANHKTRDSRIFFALYGIDDETDYYDSEKEILDALPENCTITMSQIMSAGGKIPQISLMKDFKPEVTITDLTAGVEPDGTDAPTATIAKLGSEGLEANKLVKSNALSFNYEVMLPTSGDYVMEIIIDRNGDGIFDSEGAGKTVKDGKQGLQNNATDAVKNDKVYTVKLQRVGNSDTVSGIFKTPQPDPIDSIEEFCEFRVVVKPAKGNGLRGLWTGYMRPGMEAKDVKILQLTPYADSVSLAKNLQFQKLLKELNEESGGTGEYRFNFDTGFATMNISDFADKCRSGEITAEKLKTDYDLIITGTDFKASGKQEEIDMMEPKAAQVLEAYIKKYQLPVIFTNDSLSYVNSLNLSAPVKQVPEFRDLTIKEAETAKAQGTLISRENGPYKKVRITKEEYERLEIKNAYAQSNGYDELTVSLEKSGGVFESGVEPGGVYKSVMRPISGNGVLNDGRKVKEVYVGYEDINEYNPSDKRETIGWTADNGTYPTVLKEPKKIVMTPSRIQTVIGGKLVGPIEDPLTIYFPFNAAGEFVRNLNAAKVGYITEAEARELYVFNDSTDPYATVYAGGYRAAKISITENGIPQTYVVKTKDAHALLDYGEIIPNEWVVPGKTVLITDGSAGVPEENDKYSVFRYNGTEYLAVYVEQPVQQEYGYKWQFWDTDYSLTPVAGSKSLIYPNRISWNYYATQFLRQLLGMDRFSVTTAEEDTAKRDKGSSRRYKEVKEIQGYTDGALLEYAYLPSAESIGTDNIKSKSIYKDELLALGAKPRTDVIEPLNDGIIGHYPFEINQSAEDEIIRVNENHPPLYQLDLERELGEGKIDDVTVWYTLAGSDDRLNSDKERAARYFSVTKKDAGNNYYLYSKGKVYYTGFSLTDEAGTGAAVPGTELVPEQEMKLFINTMYAALSGGLGKDESASYEVIVNPVGTVSNISRSPNVGENNKYVCYFDEYDEQIEIQLRLQRKEAQTGEVSPIFLGLLKEAAEPDEKPEIIPLLQDIYKLADDVKTEAFPVQPVYLSGENMEDLSQGQWYSLRLPFKGEGDMSQEALDGKTFIIAATQQTEGTKTGSQTPSENAIHAEITFIKRDSFELD